MTKAREWTSRDGGSLTVEHQTIYGTKRTTVETVREVIPDHESKLSAAWHLAKGSYETAKDHGIRMENYDPVVSDEMKHLAANFLRISELIVEGGFSP